MPSRRRNMSGQLLLCFFLFFFLGLSKEKFSKKRRRSSRVGRGAKICQCKSTVRMIHLYCLFGSYRSDLLTDFLSIFHVFTSRLILSSSIYNKGAKLILSARRKNELNVIKSQCLEAGRFHI